MAHPGIRMAGERGGARLPVDIWLLRRAPPDNSRPASLSAHRTNGAEREERGRTALRQLPETGGTLEQRGSDASSAEEGELVEDPGDAVREVGPAAGGVFHPMQPGESPPILPFISPSVLSGLGAQGQGGLLLAARGRRD